MSKDGPPDKSCDQSVAGTLSVNFICYVEYYHFFTADSYDGSYCAFLQPSKLCGSELCNFNCLLSKNEMMLFLLYCMSLSNEHPANGYEVFFSVNSGQFSLLDTKNKDFWKNVER